jgi:hypothetical protein
MPKTWAIVRVGSGSTSVGIIDRTAADDPVEQLAREFGDEWADRLQPVGRDHTVHDPAQLRVPRFADPLQDLLVGRQRILVAETADERLDVSEDGGDVFEADNRPGSAGIGAQIRLRARGSPIRMRRPVLVVGGVLGHSRGRARCG